MCVSEREGKRERENQTKIALQTDTPLLTFHQLSYPMYNSEQVSVGTRYIQQRQQCREMARRKLNLSYILKPFSAIWFGVEGSWVNESEYRSNFGHQ